MTSSSSLDVRPPRPAGADCERFRAPGSRLDRRGSWIHRVRFRRRAKLHGWKRNRSAPRPRQRLTPPRPARGRQLLLSPSLEIQLTLTKYADPALNPKKRVVPSSLIVSEPTPATSRFPSSSCALAASGTSTFPFLPSSNGAGTLSAIPAARMIASSSSARFCQAILCAGDKVRRTAETGGGGARRTSSAALLTRPSGLRVPPGQTSAQPRFLQLEHAARSTVVSGARHTPAPRHIPPLDTYARLGRTCSVRLAVDKDSKGKHSL